MELKSNTHNIYVLGTCNLSTWPNHHPSCYFRALRHFTCYLGDKGCQGQTIHTSKPTSHIHYKHLKLWLTILSIPVLDNCPDFVNGQLSGIFVLLQSYLIQLFSNITGQLVLKLVHSSINTHAILRTWLYTRAQTLDSSQSEFGSYCSLI